MQNGKMNKKYFKIALIALVILLTAVFIRFFNLTMINVQKNEAIIQINFLFPMQQEKLLKHIKIIPQIPTTEFTCKVSWEGKHRANIHLIEEGEITGQEVQVVIEKAPTIYSHIQKNIKIPVQFEQTPEIVHTSKIKDIPTEAPFIVSFNTPMKRAEIHKYIRSDVPFEITPVEKMEGKQRYIDYTQWEFCPKEPLKNETNYMLLFQKGLMAQCGIGLEEDVMLKLRTTQKPTITRTFPNNKGRWIALYPKVMIYSDQPIKKGLLDIEGEILEGTVQGNMVEFLLPKVLEPEKNYTFKTQIVSESGEKSEPYDFTFSTMPLKPDCAWVEVSLQEKHTVTIYKGSKPVKTMLASGGTEDQPTILGTFYLADRGEDFYSEKYGEGATYWVRIQDNYLFHGIPRDADWKIKQSELAKIGKAASHGCIRLREDDAKWFYDNVPEGTMVIIHQ